MVTVLVMTSSESHHDLLVTVDMNSVGNTVISCPDWYTLMYPKARKKSHFTSSWEGYHLSGSKSSYIFIFLFVIYNLTQINVRSYTIFIHISLVPILDQITSHDMFVVRTMATRIRCARVPIKKEDFDTVRIDVIIYMLSKVCLSSFVNEYAKEWRRVMNKDENKTCCTLQTDSASFCREFYLLQGDSRSGLG